MAFVFVTILFFMGACAEFLPYRYQNVYRMTGPTVSSEKYFADENIEALFWIDAKKIHFQIKNRTDEDITIDWGKAAFINVDQLRHKLANKDSIFSTKQTNPDPTTLAPGASLVDFVAPIANVKKLEEWTWYVYPLFNLMDKDALKNRGNEIGIDLPIKIKGEWKTYMFRFVVSNVIPSLQRAN